MARQVKIEFRYPTEKARKIADEAIDGLSVDDTMLLYLITWEEAYVGAGGVVRL